MFFLSPNFIMSQIIGFSLHFDFLHLDFLAIKSNDGGLLSKSGKISMLVTY